METQILVKEIRELAKKHGITAYDIGKNTSISLTSARNVLEEENINYRVKTLNTILEYIEKTIVGTKGSLELKKEHINLAAEPSTTYNNFNTLNIEDKLNAIFKQNAVILQNQTNLKTIAKETSTKITVLANIINIDYEKQIIANSTQSTKK